MSETQKAEIVRFRNHVRKLAIVADSSGLDGFDKELRELLQVDQRVRSNLDEFYTGSLASSVAKNRFDDVKPNESTIVRLKPISKQGDGTYINANFVDARDAQDVPFVYIATQAPLENTLLDFWRMIYENDVAFIVMLCDCSENGKAKSRRYWPALHEILDLGLLSITTTSEIARIDSVHRTFVLRTVRGDEKEVYHMQHVAWPDEGVPDSSVPLMEMIQTIGKSPRSIKSPIVVHCSGGIGRTGIFIAMHIMLAQFQKERTNISASRVVHFLKLCRSGMVQRKDQYLFVYYATLREMERMVLSAQSGMNLLVQQQPTQGKRSPVVVGTTTTATTVPRANTTALSTTSPPVMMMPQPTAVKEKRWNPLRIFTRAPSTERRRGSGSDSTLSGSHRHKDKSSKSKRDKKSLHHLNSPLMDGGSVGSRRLSEETSLCSDSFHSRPTLLTSPMGSPSGAGYFSPHIDPLAYHGSGNAPAHLALGEHRAVANVNGTGSPLISLSNSYTRSNNPLEEELLRAQQANRMKRASPTINYHGTSNMSPFTLQLNGAH